jgi:alpha-D-ribose 1-methylphosphonate 5-triphosphate synthase subunit PhnL
MFVSTEGVLDALGQAGFFPIAVAQTRTRSRSPLHARHAVRLRRLETVDLNDSVPEIILLNSHDGSGDSGDSCSHF